MIGCLRQFTLFLLSEGEGTPRQRRHLERCERCQARLDELMHATRVATTALLETPWPAHARAASSPRARFARATVATAALVVVAVLGAQSTREWLTSEPAAIVARGRPAAELSFDELSDAFSGLGDSNAWMLADADVERWQAALTGERPCEAQEPTLDARCY